MSAKILVVIEKAPDGLFIFTADRLAEALREIFPVTKAKVQHTQALADTEIEVECRDVERAPSRNLTDAFLSVATLCGKFLDEDPDTNVAIFLSPRFLNSKATNESTGEMETTGRVTVAFFAIRNRAGNEWMTCIPLDVQGDVSVETFATIDKAGMNAFEQRRPFINESLDADDTRQAEALAHFIITGFVRALTEQPTKHTLH